MIKENVRKLMNTHLEMARNTPSEEVAEVQLNVVRGFIEYAVENGDITSREFADESNILKLIREQRRVASIAKGMHHA